MEKNVTLNQCAEMCNEEQLCKAFEYDVASKKCKINHDPNPNGPKWYDWFFCQREEFVCDPGFKKISGSFNGSGGFKGGLFAYDLSECTELCANQPENCKTYQYSEERQVCKLFNESKPASNTNYQDFVSCTIDVCKTTRGPTPQQKCVFPFRFGGKLYERCTDVGGMEGFWCATGVDNSTREILLGKWGFCQEKCPRYDACFVVKGEARAETCKFPFVYNGVKYDSCMIQKDWHTGLNIAVCATKVGDGHQMIEGGICSRSCRTEKTCMTIDGEDIHRHCQFPFTYKGKQYSTCKLDHSSGKYWCATTVHPETNEVIKDGFCEASCPKENDAKGLRGLDCKDSTTLCPLLKPQCGREDVKKSCRKTCNNCNGQVIDDVANHENFETETEGSHRIVIPPISNSNSTSQCDKTNFTCNSEKDRLRCPNECNLSTNYGMVTESFTEKKPALKQKGIPLADTLKQLRKKKTKSKARKLNNFQIKNAINQAIISENNQAPFANNNKTMSSDRHKKPLQAVLEFLKLV